jgi:hypothetical protein
MSEASRHRVELWSVRRPDLTSVLHAGFDDDGELVLAGQDLGGSVEKYFGEDEYEYWYRVKPALIARLAGELAQATGQPLPEGDAVAPFVTESIRRLFAGPEHGLHFTSSAAFAEWLAEHGIVAEFSSWF